MGYKIGISNHIKNTNDQSPVLGQHSSNLISSESELQTNGSLAPRNHASILNFYMNQISVRNK